jgi:hypothetical protein
MLDKHVVVALPTSQLLILLAPAVICAMVMVGYLALRWTRSAGGPERALLLLALNLLETPVNALVISLMLAAQPAPYHPAITLPLAVLLIPVMGLSVLASNCRWVVWRLLGLGVLRWVIVGAIYLANGNSLLILLGTLVLLGCMVRMGFVLSRAGATRSVRRQIDERVARVCATH